MGERTVNENSANRKYYLQPAVGLDKHVRFLIFSVHPIFQPHDDDGDVISSVFVACVFDEKLACVLSVFDVSNQLYCVLVAADIPQL